MFFEWFFLNFFLGLGRTEKKVAIVESYLKATGLFRDYNDVKEEPQFTTVVELDLSTVVPCISGPKRPHDNVAITNVREDFEKALTNKASAD
jgi:aconitate hydratase